MKRAALAAALVVLTLQATGARGEPVLHFQSPSEVKTEGGSLLKLPPGYFLDEVNWKKLDDEMKRLQDAETRLQAENQSFRNTDGLGWGTVVVVGLSLVAGAAGALWVEHR